MRFGSLGLVSFAAIVIIILFKLELSEDAFKFATFTVASLIGFNLILWTVLGSDEFKIKARPIVFLSFLCVIVGMVIGKYGANVGLKPWIYYPVPLLMNMSLPPIVLSMNRNQIVAYLLLSFLSAPLIHSTFSFFFNWPEYMPFLEIPHYKTLVN
ncbi:MAG: hypothetical protein JSU96_02105 [Acidobacteriota bacterium]|nr:MAG: hypothetical protein JSU96_02105 [Acidobacteriota bacterium]